MHLRTLELVGYRNYAHEVARFAPGVHLIVGGNGQGKTNLVEAVAYLATGRSHRTSTESALVRHGDSEAVLRADLEHRDGSRRRVEVALRPGGRNRARVDGQETGRLADAVGVVRAVLFAPEDLVLVRGDPADRRRFLDDLLSQRRPAYRAARHDYERLLRQRNALLKQLRASEPATEPGLEAWTDQLVHEGARLVVARLRAVAALAAPVAAEYSALAGEDARGGTAVKLTYDSSTGRGIVVASESDVPEPAAVVAELREVLAERAREERERGVTLVGPHRDDLHIELGGLPARTHASQGEAWSLALALRLASRELLLAVGEEPVVLLDDVFAELDADRRHRLAAWCAGCEQVIVTAAVRADVPLEARELAVEHGRLRRGPTDGADR